MNQQRLYKLIAFSSIALLAACSNMPGSSDVRVFSERLKTIFPSNGQAPAADPRNAPVIDATLKEMCDTVRANPVTGIENYFKKRLTVRGTINNMRQNYIDDYDVFMQSPEGIPISMKVTDRSIIRSLQVDMKVEVTGSVAAVGDRSPISGYKNCRVSLNHVDITRLL